MSGGGTRPGEEVKDGPHSGNRGSGNRGGVARTAAPLRPQAGALRGSDLFVLSNGITIEIEDSGGANMTIPGGQAHNTTRMVCCNFLAPPSVLGAPASLIGSEPTSLLSSDPSICLALKPQGYPCADLHRMGERQTYAPLSPSLRLSKHCPSVKESSIWARKKSPIWGMCSGPLRC
jgi:hypothetical protein